MFKLLAISSFFVGFSHAGLAATIYTMTSEERAEVELMVLLQTHEPKSTVFNRVMAFSRSETDGTIWVCGGFYTDGVDGPILGEPQFIGQLEPDVAGRPMFTLDAIAIDDLYAQIAILEHCNSMIEP